MKAKQRRGFPTSPLEKPKPRNLSKLLPKSIQACKSKHSFFFFFLPILFSPKITKENSSTKQKQNSHPLNKRGGFNK